MDFTSLICIFIGCFSLRIFHECGSRVAHCQYCVVFLRSGNPEDDKASGQCTETHQTNDRCAEMKTAPHCVIALFTDEAIVDSYLPMLWCLPRREFPVMREGGCPTRRTESCCPLPRWFVRSTDPLVGLLPFCACESINPSLD